MKYIAIDLGLKRIGIAYSAHKDIVTPLPAVIRKNRNQASAEVKKIISEWEVDTVVIGVPLGGSSEEEMKRRIAHFMHQIVKIGCACPCVQANTVVDFVQFDLLAL